MLPSSLLTVAPPRPQLSPLVLADRLITLAQEADRAGDGNNASQLLGAAFAILDGKKSRFRGAGRVADYCPSIRA